jgi:hypothetical protein
VHHNQILVLICQLCKHVIAHDAQVNVSITQLAYNIRSPLEPHFQGGDLGLGGKEEGGIGI